MSLQIAPKVEALSTNGAVGRERLEATVEEIDFTS